MSDQFVPLSYEEHQSLVKAMSDSLLGRVNPERIVRYLMEEHPRVFLEAMDQFEKEAELKQTFAKPDKNKEILDRVYSEFSPSQLRDRNNKIRVIKFIRERTGMSLGDAKKFTEDHFFGDPFYPSGGAQW